MRGQKAAWSRVKKEWEQGDWRQFPHLPREVSVKETETQGGN